MVTLGADSANVANLLERAAFDRGDRPAILGHDGRVVWTFSALAEAASRLGTGLRAQGLGTGDRVLALVREPKSLFVIAAGALWAGCALVIPPRARGIRQALRLAAASSPCAVVADPVGWCVAALEPSLLKAPVRIAAGRWEIPGTTPLRRLLDALPSRPVGTSAASPGVISYTTGTTGEPKTVLRTHGVLRAQHEALRLLRSPRAQDVDLAGLPLLVLDNLSGGVPSVLLPPGNATRSGYGPQVMDAIQKGGATTAAGFPSLFEALVRGGGRDALNRLRAIHVGGARVRAELVDALADGSPSAEIVIVYGSTEAEPIAAIERAAYQAMAGRTAAGEGICVGQPVPGAEVRIQQLTERHDCGREGRAAGRVMVRGPQVVPQHEAGARGGWLDTGDVGWLDEAGRLWLMGRAANAGGLLPGEVEPVVEQLPWVREAALVRLERGGGYCAFLAVEPRRRARGPELAAWRSDLQALVDAQGWALDGARILDRLPRDARSGSKVQYESLKANLRPSLC